jgi:hypothetical protein
VHSGGFFALRSRHAFCRSRRIPRTLALGPPSAGREPPPQATLARRASQRRPGRARRLVLIVPVAMRLQLLVRAALPRGAVRAEPL